MKLTDKEKTTMHQYLNPLCTSVAIYQDDGSIRANIAGNLIKVTPNRYGELELKTNNMLSKDTHEVSKIMMVLEYLNDCMCHHQMNLSTE